MKCKTAAFHFPFPSEGMCIITRQILTMQVFCHSLLEMKLPSHFTVDLLICVNRAAYFTPVNHKLIQKTERTVNRDSMSNERLGDALHCCVDDVADWAEVIVHLRQRWQPASPVRALMALKAYVAAWWQTWWLCSLLLLLFPFHALHRFMWSAQLLKMWQKLDLQCCFLLLPAVWSPGAKRWRTFRG